MRKGIRIYDPSALCAGGASDGAACRRVEHCFQVGVSPTLEGGWVEVRTPRCRYAQTCGCLANMKRPLAQNLEGTEGGPWTTGSL